MISARNCKHVKLGGLFQTQKGFAFKSAWYCESGHPIVKVSDFTQDSIDASSLTQIPGEIAEKYLRYELREGDVVVQTVGSWPSNPTSVVGKCIRVCRSAHKALLNQNAVRLDPNDRIENRFLYYSLRSPSFRTYIMGTAQGAASQAAITLDAIRNYELALPPLPTQRKIGAILSAYDDLIENNTRRIKILEEMAHNLYHEWFVKFHFPSHENVKMVESELGIIPEGWEVRGAFENPHFSFIRQNIRGYKGKKRYFATADIDGLSITGEGIECTYDEKPSRAQKQPLLNSVWFARMQETYKVLPVTIANAHLASQCMLSSGFAGFQASDEGAFAFLFLIVNSDEFHAEKDRFCTGATQRSLNNDGLSRILTIAPPKELVQRFGGDAPFLVPV